MQVWERWGSWSASYRSGTTVEAKHGCQILTKTEVVRVRDGRTAIQAKTSYHADASRQKQSAHLSKLKVRSSSPTLAEHSQCTRIITVTTAKGSRMIYFSRAPVLSSLFLCYYTLCSRAFIIHCFIKLAHNPGPLTYSWCLAQSDDRAKLHIAALQKVLQSGKKHSLNPKLDYLAGQD